MVNLWSMPRTTENPEMKSFEDAELQQIFEILKAAGRAHSKKQKAVILERLSMEAKQLSEAIGKEP